MRYSSLGFGMVKWEIAWCAWLASSLMYGEAEAETDGMPRAELYELGQRDV